VPFIESNAAKWLLLLCAVAALWGGPAIWGLIKRGINGLMPAPIQIELETQTSQPKNPVKTDSTKSQIQVKSDTLKDE
jgi:hypothetical protein